MLTLVYKEQLNRNELSKTFKNSLCHNQATMRQEPPLLGMREKREMGFVGIIVGM
jgi:hypothetical protein